MTMNSSRQLDMFNEGTDLTVRPKKQPLVEVGARYRSTDLRERKRVVEVVRFNGSTSKIVVRNVDLDTHTEISLQRFTKAYVRIKEGESSIPDPHGEIRNDAVLFSKLAVDLLELSEVARLECVRINKEDWSGNEREKKALMKLCTLIFAGCYLDAAQSLRRSKGLAEMFKPTPQVRLVAERLRCLLRIGDR